MKLAALLAIVLLVPRVEGQADDPAGAKETQAPDGLKALKHPDAARKAGVR
jgi:hypothetical protein